MYMKKFSVTLIILGVINFIVGFVFNYLIFNLTYVKMLGEDVIYSTVYEEFVDPGFKILKADDYVEIVTYGEVDTSKLGEYYLTYSILYKNVEVETYGRVVKVVDDVKPNISSKDNVQVSLGTKIDKKNQDYFIKLFDINVKDNYDDRDGLKLEIDASNINIEREGKYEIIIKVSDTSGNSSSKKVYVNLKKISVKSISLNSKSITLDPDTSYVLKATVLPVDAYDKKVTWSTDNSSVVTVDSNGKVVGKTIGETNVCVQSVSNTSVKSCAKVIVKISARKKVVDVLLDLGYKKINDNLYSKYGEDGDASGTLNFDFKNKIYYADASNDSATLKMIYYFKNNTAKVEYKSDGWYTANYNYNTKKYSCSASDSSYSFLCYYMQNSTVNSLENRKLIVSEIVKKAGVSLDEL